MWPAIGIVQLEKAEALQASRQRCALRYLDKIAKLPVEVPIPAPLGSLHAWHLFPISLTSEAPISRDTLIAKLTAAQIGTSVHYRPLHRMTYWGERYHAQSHTFPVADRYFAGAVTLPLYQGMTDEEVDYVVATLEEAFA